MNDEQSSRGQLADFYTRGGDRVEPAGRKTLVTGEEPVDGVVLFNIATFKLGREAPGAKALALVSVDEPVQDSTLAKVLALPHVFRAARLSF